ncbi:MAG: ISNCY family transposase [Chloroflexota bacterium]|nr:ISNCY family transposase [Chloroflexota bacterium]
MREVVESQAKLGHVGIAEIEFDLRSRDEIPRLLKGLQFIYCTPEVRQEVFGILEELIEPGISRENGRPGMPLWKILVLGTLRLNCNWDFDKVKEIADHHDTVRMMLGHGIEDSGYRYALQTIRDNVTLFTPEILDKINVVVVREGHRLLGVEGQQIEARCDSFVVETDVHYPTDINLLWDAMRKIVTLLGRVCGWMGLTGWRQSVHIMKKLKRLYRVAQKRKQKSRRKAKGDDPATIAAHREYIDAARGCVERARESLAVIRETGGVAEWIMAEEIERYVIHAERQIDQIRRRVLEDEKIPHTEKVFSLFEEHTEWIQKGKAGVTQELGLRVCVVEDRYGFILHHMVMEKLTDDRVAVPIVEQTKERFPELWGCSFDKGFWTPENRRELRKRLGTVALRRKGSPSEAERLEEEDPDYQRAYRLHPGIESAINALENHGLDRCRDHGLEGFRRYVAMAMVGRNIQQLGNILFEIEKRKIEKEEEKAYRKAS